MLQTSDSYFVNDLDNLVKLLRHKEEEGRGRGAGRRRRSRKEDNNEQIIDIKNLLLSLCDRTSSFSQNLACCGHNIDILS